MHWNIEQILWALLLAAQLVLLIVLLGRDRVARFPWFTAGVAISTVHLLADHLLHGKLGAIPYYWQTYSISLLGSVVGLGVLVELARRVFSNGRGGLVLKPNGWIGGILVTMAIAIAVLWAWGPWPAWSSLNAQPSLLPLRLVWLSALKLDLLLAVLTVELMLLLLGLGKRFGFPWTSHPPQIAIGLSTIAISEFGSEAISNFILHQSAHLTDRDKIDHVVRMLTNLDHGRTAIWFVAIVWLVTWMWRNDLGEPEPSPPDANLEAVPAGPDPGVRPALEADLPEDPA